MANTLSLVLPVLFPSWRFFKTIEASPRVEWAAFSTKSAEPMVWQQITPRPQTLSLAQMLLRLFWNPGWNAELFIVSCAERIQQEPTPHSIEVIKRYVQDRVAQHELDAAAEYFQFRLVFVRREGEELRREVVFQSETFDLAKPAAC